MKLHKVSHVEQGISDVQLKYVLNMFEDRTGSFIDTVTLPYRLGMTKCILYGPLMNDGAVNDFDIIYGKRINRDYESRIIDKPARKSFKITVVGGPYKEEACVLIAAYGGPFVPFEPNNPLCTNIEMSKEFWNKHALT